MRRGLAFFSVASIVVACSGSSYVGSTHNDGGFYGGGVGAPCSGDTACRAGLACVNGACAPGHNSADGTACVISDECLQGSYCGPNRTCEKAGTGQDGDPCTSDSDCKSGDRCNLEGFTAVCEPEGTADVGGTCKKSGDCFAGLACADGVCTPLPPNPNGKPPLGIPSWKGADCTDDSGAVKAYFRVPRGSGDGDFYRLPFPNDVRMANGHPDYSNHPTPGTYLLGFDPVDRYLRDVEKNADGFSAYPTVYFRFSGGIDFETLKGSGVVRMVDITPTGTGDDIGYYWSATTARNKYLCQNNVTLRPPQGSPLEPAHTYAVLITTAVKDTKGNAVLRADDLTALLASSTPSDNALTNAYAAYKPLRDWAAKKSLDPSTILNAAVFTVGHVNKVATKLDTAVSAAPAPTASGWIRCGDAPSPCPQATGDRACGAADPNFDELHALVTLPIFQKGKEPYYDVGDGGDLVLDTNGVPQVQGSEQVCMSLTVPKGVMPNGGWPLVIYAHGTGGSFRSHVTEGVSARLTTVDDGQSGVVHMAVLGIDQVEHGTRRGTSVQSPNNLFYNFANPAAARGNPMQGAIDQISLLHFAKSLDLTTNQSPTKNEIKFSNIAFWGHSQGATEDAIALPYATGVSGVMLSGEGASLIDALLTKKMPVNIAAAVPFVLQDPAVDVYHPVLSVLQTDIDHADPLNHAAAMSYIPMSVGMSKNVFQAYAQNDTYSPPVTELTYAVAAGLAVAQPPGSVTSPDKSLTSLNPKPVPLGGNINDNNKPVTAVVREYMPNGFDGHFVVYKDADAIKDVNHFLADAVRGVAPKVGR
jgi:hypothetical protein